MDRLVEMSIGDWNISVRGENNLERLFVRRGCSSECIQDGCRSEHSDVIDGHNKGADVFAANIPDSRGRGICNDTRNIPSSSNVTLHDLETEAGMLAGDGRGQFVEALEWVVGDFQIEKREIHAIGVDNAIVSEVPEEFHIRGRFIQIVHPLVETRMGGSLDGRAAKVEVIHDLQGARVSEKNTEAGVWDNATVLSSRWANVDATPKRSKLRKVWKRRAAHFVRA